MSMKDDKADMDVMMEVMAMMAGFGEIDPYSRREKRKDMMSDIDKWAKGKVAEEKARKQQKEKRKFLDSKIAPLVRYSIEKKRKHTFEVSYSKGSKPVFKKK